MWLSHHFFYTSRAILCLHKITPLQKRLLMDMRHFIREILIVLSCLAMAE
jgi:hypothetical protein